MGAQDVTGEATAERLPKVRLVQLWKTPGLLDWARHKNGYKGGIALKFFHIVKKG